MKISTIQYIELDELFSSVDAENLGQDYQDGVLFEDDSDCVGAFVPSHEFISKINTNVRYYQENAHADEHEEVEERKREAIRLEDRINELLKDEQLTTGHLYIRLSDI